MRLIGTLSERQQAQEFSYYLQHQGINNTCEPARTDSGVVHQIWIVDEDDVAKAEELFDAYVKDPQSKRFHIHPAEIRRLENARRQSEEPPPEPPTPQAPTRRRRTPFGWLTILLIGVSLGCFFWGGFQTITLPDPEDPNRQEIVATPLYAALLFDYPKAFELLEEVRERYGVDDIVDPTKLPPQGKVLLRQAFSLPYWEGIYPLIVDQLRGERDGAADVSLFVKISQGEVWRLWTPAILHGSILHLIFNLFWLVILGNQIEYRIGPLRYGLLTLLGGVISNVGQYLMSGPIFLGLSGIVLAYFGFIWVRQRRAPWEAYDLHRLTRIFIAAWVILMIVLQVVAFIFELSGRQIMYIGIANTAHILGLATGALFGYWDRLSEPRTVH